MLLAWMCPCSTAPPPLPCWLSMGLAPLPSYLLGVLGCPGAGVGTGGDLQTWVPTPEDHSSSRLADLRLVAQTGDAAALWAQAVLPGCPPDRCRSFPLPRPVSPDVWDVTWTGGA